MKTWIVAVLLAFVAVNSGHEARAGFGGSRSSYGGSRSYSSSSRSSFGGSSSSYSSQSASRSYSAPAKSAPISRPSAPSTSSSGSSSGGSYSTHTTVIHDSGPSLLTQLMFWHVMTQPPVVIQGGGQPMDPGWAQSQQPVPQSSGHGFGFWLLVFLVLCAIIGIFVWASANEGSEA